MLLELVIKRSDGLGILTRVKRCHPQVAAERGKRWFPVCGFAEILQGAGKVLLAGCSYAQIIVGVGDAGLELIQVSFELLLVRRRLEDSIGPHLALLFRKRRVILPLAPVD